ncbi:hypothetical protein vBPpSSYP_84 [Pseudomonas phage vB_PpS_SYP]|nr:hypothetical protein vBPpSSYP_84 [Pseudomonas phage vB_PpS_SYP]
MADGHLNKCKECTKTDVKVHRKENDSVREYDRARGCRQTSEDLALWRAQNPNKWKAHQHIAKLVKKGLILKPCECQECGETSTNPRGIHGHHDDYSKPDVVRWLCAKCHHRWHAENGEALNPN